MPPAKSREPHGEGPVIFKKKKMLRKNKDGMDISSLKEIGWVGKVWR